MATSTSPVSSTGSDASELCELRPMTPSKSWTDFASEEFVDWCDEECESPTELQAEISTLASPSSFVASPSFIADISSFDWSARSRSTTSLHSICEDDEEEEEDDDEGGLLSGWSAEPPSTSSTGGDYEGLRLALDTRPKVNQRKSAAEECLFISGEHINRFPLLLPGNPDLPSIYLVQEGAPRHKSKRSTRDIIPWAMPFDNLDFTGISYDDALGCCTRFGVIFDPRADACVTHSTNPNSILIATPRAVRRTKTVKQVTFGMFDDVCEFYKDSAPSASSPPPSSPKSSSPPSFIRPPSNPPPLIAPPSLPSPTSSPSPQPWKSINGWLPLGPTENVYILKPESSRRWYTPIISTIRQAFCMTSSGKYDQEYY